MPNNLPRMTAQIDSETIELFLPGVGGEEGASTHAVHRPAKIDSTVTDSGNTPTSTIRGGNVLAIKSADSMAYIYDPDGADGTQNVVGVNPDHVSTLDQSATAVDKHVPNGGVIVGGLLDFSKLLNSDAHAEAVLLRRGISDSRRSVNGAGFLNHPAGYVVKATDFTVLAADNGKLHIATGAVTWTLPTIAHGLAFEFVQSADSNMVITGAADSIIYDDTGGGKATTLTWSTANQKMGAAAFIIAIPVATNTYVWYVRAHRTLVAS